MKKTLVIAILGAAFAMPTFGQEKVVKQVQRLIKADKPNIKEARELIKPTLENEETKGSAFAWFVAGEVEKTLVEGEKIKMALQQPYNEVNFYNGLKNMYDLYLKASELDALPNEKGKVKKRYEKGIKSALGNNHGFYINAGSYYLNQQKNAEAYPFFKIYMDIKDLPMFEGSPIAAKDSVSMQVAFFKAFAAQSVDSKLAIQEYEAIKGDDYRRSDVYQLLAEAYKKDGDNAGYERTILEGAKLFPKEKFFTFNLINSYIQSGRNDEAIEYLTKAIQNDPENVELINVLGKVYDQGKQDPDKALEYFQKALSINPNHSESIIDTGRVYYNKAVALKAKTTESGVSPADAKKYDAEAIELFKKALPYFEKAVELEPESTQYLMALRGIYYNLGNDAKVAEISKKLGE
ncbi:MAG: tetratricopeptide repeat protein [Porphyromonas sp.]|nr:tetratricopeptide repeat protein [Porphyromonas sp.]